MITSAAADSLAAIAKRLEKDNGLSLKGRKVVVIGAAAEMASTRHFLAMGAEVLWLDQAAPPKELKANPDFLASCITQAKMSICSLNRQS